MKVLNLYAGIGGNRKLWEDVDVTAVENDPKIATIYQDFFPDDKVIITDAHQYLLEHFREFDFIWSSPPCPSHSRIRKNTSVPRGQSEPIFPNMKLYEEILFLEGYFKGKWVVENVISWYDPLIKPYEIQRHYFWSNFIIANDNTIEEDKISKGTLEELEIINDFDASKLIDVDKRIVLRNCVNPKLGLHVFNCAFKIKQTTLV